LTPEIIAVDCSDVDAEAVLVMTARTMANDEVVNGPIPWVLQLEGFREAHIDPFLGAPDGSPFRGGFPSSNILGW